MLRGMKELFSDLNRLERRVSNYSEQVAGDLASNLVLDILTYPSIKTGRLWQAIDKHSMVVPNGYGWTIDASNNSEVFYEGFLEFPTSNRGGKSKRPGRYHFQTAIEMTAFHGLTDDYVEESLIHAMVI